MKHFISKFSILNYDLFFLIFMTACDRVAETPCYENTGAETKKRNLLGENLDKRWTMASPGGKDHQREPLRLQQIKGCCDKPSCSGSSPEQGETDSKKKRAELKTWRGKSWEAEEAVNCALPQQVQLVQEGNLKGHQEYSWHWSWEEKKREEAERMVRAEARRAQPGAWRGVPVPDLPGRSQRWSRKAFCSSKSNTRGWRWPLWEPRGIRETRTRLHLGERQDHPNPEG